MRKNLNNVLHILFVHRWAFFLPCCAGATIVFALSLSYPRTYRATTTFERGEDMLMLNLPLGPGTGSFEHYRTTMRKDILSDEVLTEAVLNLGWVDESLRNPDGEWTPEGTEAALAVVGAHRPHLDVSTSSPSEHIDYVTLTYTGPDVEIGRQILDAAKAAYIRQTMTRIHQSLEERHVYFQQHVGGLVAELEEAQRRRNELLFAHPRLDPQNPAWITQQISSAEHRLEDLRKRRAEYEEDLAIERQYMEQQLAALDASGDGRRSVAGHLADPIAAEAQALRGQMLELAREINGLKAGRGMTDAHPDIVELAAQQSWIEDRLEAVLAQAEKPDQADGAAPVDPLEPRGDDALVSQLGRGSGLKLASLKRRIREVEHDIARGTADLTELREAKRALTPFQEAHNRIETEIIDLQNRLLLNQEKKRAFEPALAAIRDGKHIYFKALKPAVGSSTPISPKTQSTFILALLAGLGAGAIFVVLAEVFDHIYRNANQVSRSLGLPVLETIDEIVTSADRRRRMLKRMVLTPFAVATALGITGASAGLAYVSIQRPWTYDQIRTIPQRAANWFADAGEETVPTAAIPAPHETTEMIAHANEPRTQASG